MFRFSLARFLARAAIVAAVVSPLAAHAQNNGSGSNGGSGSPTYPTSGGPAATNGITYFPTNGAYYIPSNNYPSNTGSPACGVGTLLSYMNLGYQGCTIGKVTFYNFTLPSYNPAYDPNFTPTFPPYPSGDTFDPSQILITPGSDTSAPSLGLSSDSLFSLTSGSANYLIEYNIDPPIDILGFGLADDPFAGSTQVRADICTNFEFSNGCGVVGDPTLVLNSTNTNVYAPFDPGTQFADVILTIHLDATNGAAVIPAFTAAVTPAPEPDVLALTAIGGLALLGTKVRRRRAKASQA